MSRFILISPCFSISAIDDCSAPGTGASGQRLLPDRLPIQIQTADLSAGETHYKQQDNSHLFSIWPLGRKFSVTIPRHCATIKAGSRRDLSPFPGHHYDRFTGTPQPICLKLPRPLAALRRKGELFHEDHLSEGLLGAQPRRRQYHRRPGHPQAPLRPGPSHRLQPRGDLSGAGPPLSGGRAGLLPGPHRQPGRVCGPGPGPRPELRLFHAGQPVQPYQPGSVQHQRPRRHGSRRRQRLRPL